jgi:hypothetical protein
MADNAETKKLMTSTLPQIFAEIEKSIESTRKAAKTTDERIAKVEQIANQAMELAELLKSVLVDGMVAMNNNFSEKGLGKDNTHSGK